MEAVAREAAATRARAAVERERTDEARRRWKDRADGVINVARIMGPLMAKDGGRRLTELILVTERQRTSGGRWKKHTVTETESKKLASGRLLKAYGYTGRQDFSQSGPREDGFTSGYILSKRYGVFLSTDGRLIPFVSRLLDGTRFTEEAASQVSSYLDAWPTASGPVPAATWRPSGAQNAVTSFDGDSVPYIGNSDNAYERPIRLLSIESELVALATYYRSTGAI